MYFLSLAIIPASFHQPSMSVSPIIRHRIATRRRIRIGKGIGEDETRRGPNKRKYEQKAKQK